MENNNRMIRVYRNVPATLSIRLADYKNLATERWFSIKSHVEFMPVSVGYIISMFMIPSTMKAYNQGQFTFNEQDKEIIKQAASDAGFYFDAGDWGSDMMEQPEVLFKESEIRGFLERGRTKEIKEIIENGSDFQKKMLLSFAKEDIGKLRGNIIDIIEAGLRVSIRETTE